MKANSIRAIAPYRWNGLWVFDDKETGLKREPFVAGADLVCEALAQGHDRFTLLFSCGEFPGSQIHLELIGQDRHGTGHNYQVVGTDQEAWLCPALLLYFTEAPQHLYAQAVNHVTKSKR